MILHLRHIFLTEALTFIVFSNRVKHGSLLSTRQEVREDTLFFRTLQVFFNVVHQKKYFLERDEEGNVNFLLLLRAYRA